MLITTIKAAIWYYPRSVFATLGLFWLVIEPIIGLTGKSIDLTYWQLFGWSAAFGIVWLVVDGLWFSGFLKQSIEIKSNGFDTRIVIKFGDIFQEDGWRAIAVNDFFDSIVDDRFVSSKSLHGILLQKYWAGNTDDWNLQVDEQLTGTACSSETRIRGKQSRYAIGTTVAVKKDGNRFLCVCGNEPLSIPLMGSGLSRVGIKNNILVDLILTAIFEETKNNKVTSEIRIVLPKEKASEINLASLQKDWS